MNWFINLRTGTKLFLGFGFIIVLLGITVFTGYRGMRQMRGKGEIAALVRTMEGNLHHQRALMLTAYADYSSTKLEQIQTQVERISHVNSAHQSRLEELTKDDPDLHGQALEFREIRKGFQAFRLDRVYPLLRAGKLDEVRPLLFEQQQQTYDRLTAVVAALGRGAQAESQRVAAQSNRILLWTGGVAVVVAFLLVLTLTRLIAAPLQNLVATAVKIGEGDLSVRVAPTDRKDEVGTLSNAFARMCRSLGEMASIAQRIAQRDLTVKIAPQSQHDQLGQAFTQMVTNLRSTTIELAESVNVLASSASEILAGTTQIAAGAAETGTAIAQTSTTIEEVKQTAQLSSQKAKLVAESAAKAARTGQSGRRAVEATVAGMTHIQAQMNSVAESVVKLSEQSQAIGEIIAAVNDLAEQSNLLAVNAAIEAAKAGEHGRGFAVVAQEVRSLAEQSKQATAQVRTILHDIQKATTATVLAAEQGSKAVETGMRQTAEAGEAIAALAESIGESAQAATQIAASSQQQLVGTDQVALAMQNIKQASTQNVAAIKQAEIAAQGIHRLGQKLKHLVDQNRL